MELTRIDDVLFALSKARGVKILILDVYRNNPLGERLSSRGTSRDFGQTRGLARVEAKRGMVIAFATQSDQIAVDGSGRNSPFTGALLREIEGRELKLQRCSAVLQSMSIRRPAAVSCLKCPSRCPANFTSTPASPTCRREPSSEAQATVSS